MTRRAEAKTFLYPEGPTAHHITPEIQMGHPDYENVLEGMVGSRRSMIWAAQQHAVDTTSYHAAKDKSQLTRKEPRIQGRVTRPPQ